MSGVFLVSAPWRLGANYASLVRTIELVLASIVLALMSEVVSRMVGAGLHVRPILLTLLVAIGAGWLAISAGSYAWSEYIDARFWSARGAEIRSVAVVGIGLSAVSALFLAASSVITLMGAWLMYHDEAFE